MTDKNLEKRFFEYVANLRRILDRQGWVVQPVIGTDGPPGAFAYTIGLQKNFDHPELAMFGFGPDYMQDILNTLAARVKAGETLPINQPYDEVFESVPVILIPVQERQEEFFNGFKSFYQAGDTPPVLQVVVPDNQGRFPWHPACDAQFKRLQILLGPPLELH